MKVLHAYNLHRGGGGADNATRATIALLRERGVEVAVFERDSAQLPASAAGRLTAFVRGLYSREAVRAFRTHLEAERPDLVHVHELYPLISPWVLPECARRGLPVVMSVYDYRLTCPVHNHFHRGQVCTRCVGGREFQCVRQNCRGRWAESVAFALRNLVARRWRLFARNIQLYITPTRFTADWLTAHAGVAAEAVCVVPCAIRLPGTTVDPAAGRYAAFAGRFVPEKGVEVAVAAARQARVPLWLAGDADTHPAVRPGDEVRFVRTRGPEQLAEFYRGARVLVMPSIWFETFGIVVGEAMSHGVPVLASGIGALAETTVDGVTGLHFRVGDAGDLAGKLRRLWEDDERCRALGAAARRHIERTASPARHVELMLAAYARVLGRAVG